MHGSRQLGFSARLSVMQLRLTPFPQHQPCLRLLLGYTCFTFMHMPIVKITHVITLLVLLASASVFAQTQLDLLVGKWQFNKDTSIYHFHRDGTLEVTNPDPSLKEPQVLKGTYEIINGNYLKMILDGNDVFNRLPAKRFEVSKSLLKFGEENDTFREAWSKVK